MTALEDTIGNVAASPYDGYQDGGGWKGALTEAGKGLAIGWITGKASEIAVAKLGTVPSFKTPPARERPPTVEDFLNAREFRQAQEAGKMKVRAFCTMPSDGSTICSIIRRSTSAPWTGSG